MRDDGRGLDLSIRGLHALTTVIEEGHFGRAAARLFVTVSALSQQIRRLEQQVGTRLVNREAHPIALTPAGEQFLPHARRVLEAAEGAALAIARFERRQDRVLRIGFINGVAGPATNALLSRLHGKIELTQLDWPEQLTAVASGSVDACFIRPPLPEQEGLVFEPLAVEPRVATVHRGHRLAGRPSISISELDGEVHIDTEPEVPKSWIRWWAVDPRPSGARVEYGPVIRTMEEQLQVVASGAAISITAASIADYYSGVGVDFIPIDDVEPCAVELCTRVGDDHPGVLELRRAVAEVRASAAG